MPKPHAQTPHPTSPTFSGTNNARNRCRRGQAAQSDGLQTTIDVVWALSEIFVVYLHYFLLIYCTFKFTEVHKSAFVSIPAFSSQRFLDKVKTTTGSSAFLRR